MSTVTTDDKLDALIAQLQAMGMPLDITALAAGALPPSVAAGQLITSAWGNGVVDELTRLRGQMWSTFSHPGSNTNAAGLVDCGTTALGPFTYGVRVTVHASIAHGFSGSGAAQASARILRLVDNGTLGGQNVQAATGMWVYVPLLWVYDVPAGSAAGFKTQVNVVTGSGGSVWYASHGTYFVHRTGVT